MLLHAVSAAVEVDSDFRCIRRRLPYAGREGFDIVTPFEASSNFAQEKLYASILIPAKSRSTLCLTLILGVSWSFCNFHIAWFLHDLVLMLPYAASTSQEVCITQLSLLYDEDRGTVKPSRTIFKSLCTT